MFSLLRRGVLLPCLFVGIIVTLLVRESHGVEASLDEKEFSMERLIYSHSETLHDDDVYNDDWPEDEFQTWEKLRMLNEEELEDWYAEDNSIDDHTEEEEHAANSTYESSSTNAVSHGGASNRVSDSTTVISNLTMKPTSTPTTETPTETITKTTRKVVQLLPFAASFNFNVPTEQQASGISLSRREEKGLTRSVQKHLKMWFGKNIKPEKEDSLLTVVRLSTESSGRNLRDHYSGPARRLKESNEIKIFFGTVVFRHISKQGDWEPPTQAELYRLTQSAFGESNTKSLVEDINSIEQQDGILSYISGVTFADDEAVERIIPEAGGGDEIIDAQHRTPSKPRESWRTIFDIISAILLTVFAGAFLVFVVKHWRRRWMVEQQREWKAQGARHQLEKVASFDKEHVEEETKESSENPPSARIELGEHKKTGEDGSIRSDAHKLRAMVSTPIFSPRLPLVIFGGSARQSQQFDQVPQQQNDAPSIVSSQLTDDDDFCPHFYDEARLPPLRDIVPEKEGDAGLEVGFEHVWNELRSVDEIPVGNNITTTVASYGREDIGGVLR